MTDYPRFTTTDATGDRIVVEASMCMDGDSVTFVYAPESMFLDLEKTIAMRDVLNALIEEAQKPKPIEAPAGVFSVVDRYGDKWELVQCANGPAWLEGDTTYADDRDGWDFDRLVQTYGPVYPLTIGEAISA